MDEIKVQIGDDVLLDIGTHSDWYISVICYNNESVNVELRRKADRNNKWWVAEQTENNSEKPNNSTISKMEQVDEPKTKCQKCNNWFYDGDYFGYMCERFLNELPCKFEPKDESQPITDCK